ncbi:hypothetical protein HYH03_006998 [Edaphochlamys debaryana]|uniref:Chitinase domain-containing protein 1 n=1 Tax=Edaphochlamys debaryana TaxID=47281 RepID=A0A835Y4U6_9CHLO|nr:hypothetical protein HYH03_006998 [Edaphochlamys debaryana]|eukprot:KAG2494753.1 hypothetical protein HYH03_006998 [Edaphochlamys debaryana]
MIVASRWVLAAAVLLLAMGASVVDGAKRRGTRTRREIDVQTGPSEEQVWDSGLMEKEVSYATLIEHGREYHSESRNVKRVRGFVLGYVTPWNRLGYEMAVRFRKKLDAVSPVWFQVKQEQGATEPSITGGHEVNQTWIKALRKGGKGPLVVPRFILEGAPGSHVAMLSDQRPLVEGIVKVLEDNHLDGLVLEAWSAWHSFNGLQNDHFRQAAFALIQSLHQVLDASGGKKLFLAVPPLYPSHEKAPWLARDDMIELSKWVDGFSVMTYDYSSTQGRPGPNSPAHWVSANLEVLKRGGEKDPVPPPPDLEPKFLLGVNFYGWDSCPSRASRGNGAGALEALTAPSFLKLLQQHQPALEWQEEAEEHMFEYVDKDGFSHTVFYPTPRSLEARLQAAQTANVGLSIWELGQGMERFFDLL